MAEREWKFDLFQIFSKKYLKEYSQGNNICVSFIWKALMIDWSID